MLFEDEGPVIVIGAGLAGLTAAWRLRQAGRAVIVLEAGDEVGGRTIVSSEGWHAGQYANLGGELIDATYHALRGVCVEVGVELAEPQHYAAPEEGDLSAIEGYLRVATFVVDGSVLSREECDQVAAELRAAVLAHEPTHHEIVEQWIRRAGLSPTTAGVVRGAATFFCQLDAWDCDVHYLFGGASGTFQRIRGGTQQLAFALADGLDVRLGQRVVRVERGRTVRVTTESGDEYVGTRLICAVGPFALPSLGFDPPLPDEKVMAATSFLPAMAGKVIAQYSEGDLVREAFGSLVCTDGAINSAWVSVTDVVGGPAVVTSFFAGAHRVHMAKPEAAFTILDDLVAKVVGQPVTRLHGEIKNWWADPLHLGVTIMPAAESRGPVASLLSCVDQRTHFAGDYTDAPMSGTLEAAVRSGIRAADEVLRSAPVHHTNHVTERLSLA